jgi:TetR/AcrR family transcriptional regulator, transcriptional repressor for nem operon
MKVTRERMAQNRQKILDAASGLFRERGFDSVTVADVMNAAGLTHGGFYGHFTSKDTLIAEAMSRTFGLDADADGSPDIDLAAYATNYLSTDHRNDCSGGCPVAALGTELPRQSEAARDVATAGVARLIGRFAKNAAGETDDERRREAIGSYAAMVGAVVLARLSAGTPLSDEILAKTREWIGQKKPVSKTD